MPEGTLMVSNISDDKHFRLGIYTTIKDTTARETGISRHHGSVSTPQDGIIIIVKIHV